jgi:hypothetical protein
MAAALNWLFFFFFLLFGSFVGVKRLMQLGRLVALMSPERRDAPLSSFTSLHKTPKLYEPLG